MQKYAARPRPSGTTAGDVLCYEDLLDEALGLILEHNFNVFKILSCDHNNVVSATGPTQ